jgi:hypothetical protein
LIWGCISDLLGVRIGLDFESVAQFWLANKRHKVLNIVSSAVLWSMWKFRNEMCFQGRKWKGMKDMLFKIARMLRRWMSLLQQEMGSRIEEVIVQLEVKASFPPQLMWRNQKDSLLGSVQLGAQPLTSSAVDPNQQVSEEITQVHIQSVLVGRNALSNSAMLPLN